MPIYNKTQRTVLARQAFVANNFLKRSIGLLGRERLDADEALIIPQCQAIHMFFMRFPIDVVFVDRKHHVVGLVHKIKPFCMSPLFWKAYFAIELPAGTIERTKTVKGDVLDFELV